MRASAGRDADAQVRLALWCEAHGLERERLKHLAMAVLADPSNVMARGLMGLVEYGGKWKRPEAVADAIKADVKHADLLAEYAGRRVRTPVKPDAQWKLALWCEEKGLRDKARAHLATVVRLDPTHAEAWKKLGYRKAGNRWVTEAKAAAGKAEAQAKKSGREGVEAAAGEAARRPGGPRKERPSRSWATSPTRGRPWVWSSLATGGARSRRPPCRCSARSTRSRRRGGWRCSPSRRRSAEVRRRTVETLRRRDPREWAGPLIALIRDKVKYEVKPVGGPGSPGVLLVEGKEANVRRLYSPRHAHDRRLGRGNSVTTDAFGSSVLVSNNDVSAMNFESGIQQVKWYRTQAQAKATLHQYSTSRWRPRAAADARRAQPRRRRPRPADEVAGRRRRGESQAGCSSSSPSIPRAAREGTVNADFPSDRRRPDGRPGRPDDGPGPPRGRLAPRRSSTADVAALDRRNAQAAASNDRVVAVLAGATGLALPATSKPWARLVHRPARLPQRPDDRRAGPDHHGGGPPRLHARARRPLPAGRGQPTGLTFRRLSCFGAGTSVRTISGPRPIETLLVGDLVLAQDVATGRLGYRPVTVVHHNPPSPTYPTSSWATTSSSPATSTASGSPAAAGSWPAT